VRQASRGGLRAAQRLAAIDQSLGDVDPGNVLLAVKIGKGAGDTQRAVIAAGAQRERVGCIAQQREPSGLWRRDLLASSRRTRHWCGVRS
jgi:hypothetical protein